MTDSITTTYGFIYDPATQSIIPNPLTASTSDDTAADARQLSA
ncbi:hypothetical protein ACUWEX_11095 [Okibacterium fritillariae]